MLTLTIGGKEYFDESQMRFITPETKVVQLEHCLKALARWESKWNTSFLSAKSLTREQQLDYYWCMEMTGSVDRDVFLYLTKGQERQIEDYINQKMTATTIARHGPQPPSRKIVTAEVIYFWMIQNGIPFECDTWHLNRLMMLIEVCAAEGGPKKKMSMREQMDQQRALNASRLKQFKTRG